MKKRFCIWWIGVMLVVSGCARGAEMPAPSPTRAATVAPPASVTHTATATMVASITPIPTVTQTPAPTLAAKDSIDLIIEYLHNNGNCDLPCIWGITPEKTTAEEMESFVRKFGDYSQENFSSDRYISGNLGSVFFYVSRENLRVQIGIDYQINQNSVQSLTFTARAVKPDSNSEFGNPAFNDLLRFYLFSETLVNNGMPLQASIATWHEDPILKAPYTPFSLLLDYSDKGFLIEYVMPNKIVGNSFLGCPAETYIRITMWSPDQNYSIEDVLKWGSGGEGINSLNLDYFRPIDQATPMNLETFFQSFNKSESKICLETPVDLWFKP